MEKYMEIRDNEAMLVGIMRESDRVFIPIDATNRDYAEYLNWLNSNTPLEYNPALIPQSNWD